ncbi:hypothetical protein POX_c03500 [Penicillium oxalicum]|uniref:Uncharacterized protein n=1 Tax=Penicillium oxalicum (strain 114-2 / CGMCC 5302) TaxID=933388 RepID=S7Z4Q0_PENO1|nr:hypothetical protein POX_c03500 [Penicillium oxalicum]EPS25094.1 hypothetical protein PDE_00025 [Penicillium oxalicum 114-2]KAI2790654.1 hypothetical protein POX_c03500 [Penicillium oxalicum]
MTICGAWLESPTYEADDVKTVVQHDVRTGAITSHSLTGIETTLHAESQMAVAASSTTTPP